MMAAPASCRVATNRAPAPTSALVTWKLPLPTTPKTWSSPRRASSRPIASATRTVLFLSTGLVGGAGGRRAGELPRARRNRSAADQVVAGRCLLDDVVRLEEAHLLVDG